MRFKKKKKLNEIRHHYNHLVVHSLFAPQSHITTFNNIIINSNGGVCHPGKALTEADWADIYLAYLDIVIDVNADKEQQRFN